MSFANIRTYIKDRIAIIDPDLIEQDDAFGDQDLANVQAEKFYKLVFGAAEQTNTAGNAYGLEISTILSIFDTRNRCEIDTFDELYTKSLGRGAASMLLNDNILEYSGEDYEDVYLNVFKALNYVELDEFDDAFVEIRKINEKLSLLEQKYRKMAKQYNTSKDKKKNFESGTNKFHNSALGRYLSMLLYRAEGKMDDARIDKEKIDEAWQLQSHIYNFSKPSLNNLLKRAEAAFRPLYLNFFLISSAQTCSCLFTKARIS